MKILFGKIILYSILLFIALELIVRVFHLYSEYPTFIINDKNVKTYAPNQDGYYTTGNRRMNFAQYHINKTGFNSYREFTPSENETDIAIIGDSFIEGLHQNYNNSIGKKLEHKLNDSVNVFEYGHSGYDFADQLHLISAYKEKFQLIDKTIIYLKFENDLKRDFYEPDQYWVDSQYFLTRRIAKKIKLINYAENIGLFEPLRDLKRNAVAFIKQEKTNPSTNLENTQKKSKDLDNVYLNNFKKLIAEFEFDKNKTVLLLDSRATSDTFLNFCNNQNIKYIDFATYFENSTTPTTLIYDMHWNNHGRELIANAIADYIKKEQQNY